MTVNYKGERPEGRTFRNSRGVRAYQRTFALETTAQTEGPYLVGSHPSLPKIGDLHPDDTGAWCDELFVENVDGWKVWTVTANYTSEWDLNQIHITWDSEQFQKPAVMDKDGNGVVNSAGDPFDPPAMMDDSRRVITVTRMMQTVPTWILNYQDAVNSDQFVLDGVTIAIGQAKLQRVSVSDVRIINSIPYREVTFQIHLQLDGWSLQVFDGGFRDINFKTLYNADGTRPSAPIPLNGSGLALNSSNPADAVFLPFSVYNSLPFASLPLS